MKEVDAAKHRARVTFPERQDLVSPWLDVLAADSLDDKAFGLPSVGAQVAVLLDEKEEAGCVLGAVYSQVDVPDDPANADVRRIKMKDGGAIEYDRAAHTLKVTVPDGGKLSMVVGGDVEITPSGLLKIAGASDFVALAQKVETEFESQRNWNATHMHPTGVGPSGPPTAPPPAVNSVAASKTKTE